MSASAGVRVLVRLGERVRAGQPLLEVHADDEAHLEAGLAPGGRRRAHRRRAAGRPRRPWSSRPSEPDPARLHPPEPPGALRA